MYIYIKYNALLCACRFGPLVRFWCMRFESKHNYFKDFAHRVKCFKNIPKSFTKRHQEFMCYHLNSCSKGSPFTKNIMIGPGNNIETLIVFI